MSPGSRVQPPGMYPSWAPNSSQVRPKLEPYMESSVPPTALHTVSRSTFLTPRHPPSSMLLHLARRNPPDQEAVKPPSSNFLPQGPSLSLVAPGCGVTPTSLAGFLPGSASLSHLWVPAAAPHTARQGPAHSRTRGWKVATVDVATVVSLPTGFGSGSEVLWDSEEDPPQR